VVAVPRWMRAYETVAAIAPDRWLGAIRGRLTRSRVLGTIDSQSRNAYDERLRRTAG
jgi:hypothetical protein